MLNNNMLQEILMLCCTNNWDEITFWRIKSGLKWNFLHDKKAGRLAEDQSDSLLPSKL